MADPAAAGGAATPPWIEKTQVMLGKIIKKPKLTENLLNKPPFRFLHDIITEVQRQTKFAEGLFDPSELDSANIKDKDAKVAYLQKIIDCVGIALNENVPAKPLKIAAGLNPEETNVFLQQLARVCLLGEDISKQSVARVRAGEKCPAAGAAAEKKAPPPQPKKEAAPPTAAPPAAAVPPQAPPQASVQRPPQDPKAAPPQRPPQPAAPGPQAAKTSPSVQGQTPPAQPPPTASQKPPPPNPAPPAPSAPPPQPKPPASADQPAPAERPSVPPRTASKRPPPVEATRPLEEELPAKPQLEATVPRQPESRRGSRSGPSILPASEDEEQLRHPDPDQGKQDKSDEAPDKLKLPERPQTARRAPPKLPTNIVPVERKEKPQQAGIEKPVAAAAGVIVEGHKADDDEDDNMIIQNVVASATTTSSEGEKGALAQKLLGKIDQDQKKAAEKEDTKEGTGIVLGGKGRGKQDKQSYGNEIQKLRESIQQLCQNTNPLGKCMDYVQEDIDNMAKELDMWISLRANLNAKLEDERRTTEQTLQPLYTNLHDIENQIKEQVSKINQIKGTILRNDIQISNLLRLGYGSQAAIGSTARTTGATVY